MARISLTTREKVLLTILLAVLFSWAVGCSQPSMLSSGIIIIDPNPPIGDVDELYLKQVYASYNDLYFDNKLPKDTKISNDLGGLDMADTLCDEAGQNCVVRFNPHWTAAPRVSESVMLHEMCHIRVWTKLLEKDRPEIMNRVVYNHSKPWQSCMLVLDAEGAFRRNNIDYYQGR